MSISSASSRTAHSAVRKIPWDWESAERRRLFSAQSLGVLSCPVSAKVWEKAGERVSLALADVTSHEQRTPRAGTELFSADVAVVGAAIVGDVCSPIEGELSPKVG